MIVLDTTVLVYAKGAEHPLRDPCRDLVAAIADERIAATTTAEVIQEFVHVRARRRDRSDAAALGRVTMPNCSRRYSPSIEATSKRGLTLFETTPGLEACDAVLAAVAASAGATALSRLTRRSPICRMSCTSFPTRPGWSACSATADGPGRAVA